MKNTKITSVLISVSMTILVFTGCGNTTKAPNGTKAPMYNTTKPPMNESTKPNKSISTATMKMLYSKTLKDLVTEKTITKTQSKKVLAAITKNMTQNSGTTNNNTGAPNTGTEAGTSTGTGSTNSTSQTGTSNNTTNVINGLSSLVKNKVITQTQSNTIHQRMQIELTKVQSNK